MCTFAKNIMNSELNPNEQLQCSIPFSFFHPDSTLPTSCSFMITWDVVAGICTICKPWESLLIGGLGAAFATTTDLILYRLRVDDPVGVVPVHFICGAWGLLAVGKKISLPSLKKNCYCYLHHHSQDRHHHRHHHLWRPCTPSILRRHQYHKSVIM